jgi:hypothetical protein
MSASSILEARERNAVTTRASFLPSEDARLPKIEAAVALIQEEIARLRLLQRREDQKRAARAANAEVTARALAKFEQRERDRDRMISVDRAWFWSVAEGLLERLDGEQGERLARDLNALVDRERRLKGG